MKNIHVLPTDKPSELYINMQGVLSKSNSLLLRLKSRNIYITSDEEIKEGVYGIVNGQVGKIIITHDGYEFQISKNVSHLYGDFYSLKDICEKIILTNDPTLIEDGVQAIPDEFLEWFVKNPSCEWVEVISNSNYEMLYKVGASRHKIIIPKEEPKQEMRKVCKCKRAYENPLSEICSLCWNELYPNEKDEIKDEDLLEPKQETLEEANFKVLGTKTDTFYNGAKWQQERMYSDEDMQEYAEFCIRCNQNTLPCITAKDWFEQFKKK